MCVASTSTIDLVLGPGCPPLDYRSTTARPQVQFLAGKASVEYLLSTTDDNVLEMPDETLTIALYIPGMFPSYLGDLIAGVVIQVTTLADMASFSSSGLSKVSTRRCRMTHTSSLVTHASYLMPHASCLVFGRNMLLQQKRILTLFPTESIRRNQPSSNFLPREARSCLPRRELQS